MKKIYLSLLGLLLMFLVIGCSSSVDNTEQTNTDVSNNETQQESQPSIDFPKDDLEFVVGYNPGGGYSQWAQSIAQFMGDHLPNKVKVEVRHMDGAGGVTALNYLQNAEPDGHTFEIINLSGLGPTQLAREVEYDLTEMTWLATVNKDTYTAVVNPDSGYKSLEDLKKKGDKVIVATRGMGSNDTIAAAIIFSKLGIEWEPLVVSGTSEVVLSAIRGDADVVFSTYESIQESIAAGDLDFILHFGDEPHPDYPDVPMSNDVGLSEFNDIFSINRVIAAPPGVSGENAAVLEKALKDTLENPEFIAMMEKANFTIVYEDAKGTEKIVLDTIDTFSKYQDILKEMFVE
ncbi:Bug family tripartite tricarboxylate transporter substrate binding protein [Bacillus sp. Marseille-P3661]|uniref:Bug family tripartite tricarboxylate transporter substrate binding protein n=1 Tax=Bacillus sp. Marseille-P3661 TaxID=1936234 RepID=UPI0015E164B4|nr:tripartite tricarboxylate transporter substrate binding protein [Bacillus sp. Marseille-P3661]